MVPQGTFPKTMLTYHQLLNSWCDSCHTFSKSAMSPFSNAGSWLKLTIAPSAGGVVRDSKRGKSRTLGLNMPPMPASRLAYSLEGLEEVSLSAAPQRWSKERCRNCLAKVMGCLKVPPGSANLFSLLKAET